jgi:hypothetical protein
MRLVVLMLSVLYLIHIRLHVLRTKRLQSLHPLQALWQLASAPFRQVGFMCFMMWMMGNSIQIFSIIMTLSGLAAPIMAIYNSKSGKQMGSAVT